MTTTEHPIRPRLALANPTLLDFPAAQHYLGGISRSTLKLLVWRGILAPTRIGKRVFFSRSVLDAYVDRQTREQQRKEPA